MGKEELEIRNCPLCGKRHVYQLLVERTMSMITGRPEVIEFVFGKPSDEVTSLSRERTHTYTKSFRCPVKNKSFEYSFMKKETHLSSIFSIHVGDPINDYEEISTNTETQEDSELSGLHGLEQMLGERIPLVNSIERDTFGYTVENESIIGLGLSNKGLSSLPESFGNLSNLQILFLTTNQLRSLPESFGNLIKLNQLNLGYNQLVSLPKSFSNLINLQSLSLLSNCLTSLPESSGNLTHIQFLSLRNNQLKSLHESIGNLTNLQVLDLSGYDVFQTPATPRIDSESGLRALPESIGNLANLKKLILENNRITSLPPSIGNLSNLEELVLWSNKLSSLPESIGNLINLKELRLENNQLTTLPESIGKLIKLKRLGLMDNQLTAVPESIGELKFLKQLSLANNPLTTSPEWFQQWIATLEKNYCEIYFPQFETLMDDE